MNECYLKDIDEVLKDIDSKYSGLDNKEAQERLQMHGYNRLKEAKKQGIILKFLNQFKDVMLLVLIIAAILSAVVSARTGESFTDTIIILFVVFLNAILELCKKVKQKKQ